MQKNHFDENKVVTKMKQLKFVLLSTLCQACAELWATKGSKKYKLKINNQIVLIKKNVHKLSTNPSKQSKIK